MKPALQYCAVILMFIMLPVASAPPSETDSTAPIRLTFPGSSNSDWQNQYPIQLMQLALSQQENEHYQLAPSDMNVPKGRNFHMLTQGKHLHFLWSTATQERVENYHEVPFPIMKGAFGLRLALVHNTQKNQFESVKTVEDLQFFIPGQMHIWTDAKIFKHNDINVYDSPSYEVLFEMLAKKRFDYFPRAIVEVGAELAGRTEMPITLDQHILIHYPTALYFYTYSQQLSELVLTGLDTIVKSGEFEQLFQAHHATQMQHLKLEQRTVINLENPFAPKNLPLQRDELWLSDVGNASHH